MFPCNPDIGAVKGLVTRFSAMIRSCGAPCFHNDRHSAGARASGYGQPPFCKNIDTEFNHSFPNETVSLPKAKSFRLPE